MELDKKVSFAVDLLKSAAEMADKHGQILEISYSGGKDSDVILDLAKLANIPYEPIYKVTTIDPPGTEKHARDNGATVIMPTETFAQLVGRKGLPNRFRRFCCEVLKEYRVRDYAVIGVRRDESKKRADRYKEPEVCKVYSKTEKVRQYLPLLDFTQQDVEDYVNMRGLRLHPHYYDEDGNLHCERRLGCVGCPLGYWKHREKEFLKYPGFIRVYLRGMRQYFASHPQSNLHTYFPNVYAWFCFYLYCDTLKEFRDKFLACLDNPNDFQKYLEERFQINL